MVYAYSYRSHPGLRPREPGGKDNIPILQLKWISGKMKSLPLSNLMPASNATSRFSDRVENYVRYRPGYPPEVAADTEDRMRLDRQPFSG